MEEKALNLKMLPRSNSYSGPSTMPPSLSHLEKSRAILTDKVSGFV